MDELARIIRDFLQGQELMLRAFNDLLRYQRQPATRLFPTFGAVVPKGSQGSDISDA